MIVYDPLWRTMKEKNISQYKLIKEYNVSTYTLNDIVEYKKAIDAFRLITTKKPSTSADFLKDAIFVLMINLFRNV